MTNAARTPLGGTRLQQRDVGRRWRADEHEVGLAVGHLVDGTHGVDAEHRAALEVRREDAALVSAPRGCCAGRRSRTCRDARRAGDDHASRIEERAELLRGEATGQRSTSTSASTATGTPSTTISGLRSTDCDRRVRDRGFGEPEQHVGEALAVDRRLAAERAEQRLTAEVVDHLAASTLSIGTTPERHVRDGLGEHPADAEHDGHAELRITVEPRDELAIARHHRRDEHADLAVLGRRRREKLARRDLDVSRGCATEPYEPPLGLVRDRRAAELHHDGIADRVGCARPHRRPSPRRARRERERRNERRAPWTRPRRGSSRPQPRVPTLPTVFTMTGVMEGFYGTPWSWDDRVEVMQWCRGARPHRLHVRAERRSEAPQPMARAVRRRRARGLPFPRRWRRGAHRLRDLPGLAMDEGSAADRAALVEKLAPLLALGITHIGLFLDDLPPDPSRSARDRGEAHADLAAWLHDRLGGDVLLSLVPTEYIGTLSSPYLDALARVLPPEIPIGWTGASVVNDEITADDARARVDALGGRAPLLWDNVPVNDAVMADRLFMGPLRGRASELRGALLRLPREPDGATTGLDASARLDRGMVCRRRPGARLARRGRRTRVDDLRGGVRRRGPPARLVRATGSTRPTARRGRALPMLSMRGSPTRRRVRHPVSRVRLRRG